MNIGAMRHRIEFQKYQIVYDDGGFPTENKDYVTFQKAYASVNDLYGKEKEAAKQNISETITVFYTRYFKDIDSKCFILFRGQRYEIIEPPDNIKYLNKEFKIKARLQVIKNGI